MSDFYTGVMVLSVFSMVIMILITRSNVILSHRKQKQFTAVYVLTILGALSEWGAMLIGSISSHVGLHIVVKTFELMIAPAIPLFILRVISDNRKYARIMLIVVCANAAVEVLSALFGFIFYVDSSNVYHHGTFYGLYVATYMFMCVMLIVATVDTIRQYRSNSANMLTLLLAFFVTGIVMQNLESSIRVDYITVAIVLIFYYVEYTDVLQGTDSLTKLLNRHSYDNRISNLSERAIVINLDIDCFKECNDRYGHLYGDKCLRIVSSMIWSVCSKVGDCYRTGGDEFCIIVTDPDVDAEYLLLHIHEAMGRERLTEPSLPFISTGYAVYEPGTSIVTTIEKADSMMYRFKNYRKALWEQGKNPGYREIQCGIGSEA